MEPLIGIRLIPQRRSFEPGDELGCQYQVDAASAEELQAIEASVVWYSEGKGDEDLGVHFFERRVPDQAARRDLRQLWEFRTQLPQSPLSYDGAIIKLRWCVRVRVFLRRGREVYQEAGFDLGPVIRARAIVEPQPEETAEVDASEPPPEQSGRQPAGRQSAAR